MAKVGTSNSDRTISLRLQWVVKEHNIRSGNIPDYMKKLTIALLVLSANDVVPKIFRNGLKHCRNFGAAGGFGRIPLQYFF